MALGAHSVNLLRNYYVCTPYDVRLRHIRIVTRYSLRMDERQSAPFGTDPTVVIENSRDAHAPSHCTWPSRWPLDFTCRLNRAPGQFRMQRGSLWTSPVSPCSLHPWSPHTPEFSLAHPLYDNSYYIVLVGRNLGKSQVSLPFWFFILDPLALSDCIARSLDPSPDRTVAASTLAPVVFYLIFV